MDIELEKLKKLEHTLCDAIDTLRDWQIEEVKSEEEKWIVYLARQKNGLGYLTACREDAWEDAQKDYHAKTKMFVGSAVEVTEWYKARQKFAEVIKAWEDGKKIQVTPKGKDKWLDLHCEPKWDLRDEYRVKPECPCEDGIDSKACVGCEHSEDGKRKYKPYVTVDEFIQDFQERFPTAVPRPAHTMPLIWLTNIVSEEIHLVTGFNMTDENENEKGVCIRDIIWSFRELFGSWIFLDGSPVGMEVKE